MRRNPFPNYTRWTNHEIRHLKECFAGMSDKDLAIVFSPHPISSIRTMAKKYGLRRPPRGRDWKKIASKYTPMIFSVNRVPLTPTENANDRAFNGT